MKKLGLFITIYIIFLVSAFAQNSQFSLNKQEKQYLQNIEVIKVSNEMDWAPFDYVKNGEPAGYSIGLMNLISKRIGVEFKYVNGLSWEQLLKEFRLGNIDIMSAINYTENRSDYALFTEPYFQNNIAVFAPERSMIHTLADLKGKKVALPRGYSILNILNEQVDNLIHIPVKDTQEAIKAVSTGRADYTIESASMVQHKISELGIRNIRIRFFPEFDYGKQKDVHLRAAVHRENPILFSIVQKALNSITKEEKSKLKQKWQPSSMTVTITDDVSGIQRLLTKNQKDFIKEKKYFRFCADPNWMPYEGIDQNNNHKGMAADIVQILSDELDVEFKLVPTKDWSQTLSYLKQRKCDLSFMNQATTTKENYLDFTTAYYSFSFVIATKTDELFIDNIANELHKTFGIVKDYSTDFKLRQSYPGINLKYYDKILTGLNALKKGKIDGFIDTTNTIGYLLNANSITNLKIGGKVPIYYNISISSRDDWPTLGHIMQKAVDSLTQKEKDRIYNRWVAVVQQKQYDYSLLWKILLGVSLIIAAILYSNSRLRKAKKETTNALYQLQQAQKELKKSNKQLHKASVTDHLTGLYNRKHLDEILQQEFLRAKRYGTVFGIILLDLDDFKEVNDNKGHQVGDEVLVQTAKLLQNNCRRSDSVGRWGGEEFLIICPQTEKKGVINAANNLREELYNHNFNSVEKQTASFGVTIYTPDTTIVSLIANVDKALYKAKEKDKNTVVFN